MPKRTSPRKGSLQYWPRKRAKKFLPSVNWRAVYGSNSEQTGLLGFICYKVGMGSAYVRDNTPDSMTKNKRIVIPATILECPPLKILSIRLYKEGKVIRDILCSISKDDKELKKKIKIPKTKKDVIKELDEINKEEIDDIRVIVYSVVKRTNIKKKPDLIEFGIGGNFDDKIIFIKKYLDKEIPVSEVFKDMQLVDIRGLTKGKGTAGPVKRFGIKLKPYKTEKGRRKPGSLGPWHPARVTFRAPMAGQLGMFSRITYNHKIIKVGKIAEANINPSGGFKHFGEIKTDYIILAGSIPGPQKRQVLATFPIRKTKKQDKKNYEFMELR